jgi:transposase
MDTLISRIGVDEISYKRGHQYLTVVADHDTGRVVWVGRERSLDAARALRDLKAPQRPQGPRSRRGDQGGISPDEVA